MKIQIVDNIIDSIKSKKILLDDIELSNAATIVEWGINPIQVQICDSCAVIGCNNGGYVDIYKEKDYYIVTIPSIYEYNDIELARRYPHESIIKKGPIVIESSEFKLIESCYNMNYEIKNYPEMISKNIILNYIISQPFGSQYIDLANYFHNWIDNIKDEIIFVENEDKENVLLFLADLVCNLNIEIKKSSMNKTPIGIYLNNSEEITGIVKFINGLAIQLNDDYIIKAKCG